MTVHIDIAPETEAELSAQAAARGIVLSEYLRQILEEQASSSKPGNLSPAARAALWRESAKGIPASRPIPDDAVGRESIYASRG